MWKGSQGLPEGSRYNTEGKYGEEGYKMNWKVWACYLELCCPHVHGREQCGLHGPFLKVSTLCLIEGLHYMVMADLGIF
jgi:hypothetical protein